MSKEQRGKRDGTGPYKGSSQKRFVGIGKRKASGMPCPIKK